MLFIYIDITSDEFQATSLFQTLLETVYMPLSYQYNTITNIPEDLALSKYIKKYLKPTRLLKNFSIQRRSLRLPYPIQVVLYL